MTPLKEKLKCNDILSCFIIKNYIFDYKKDIKYKNDEYYLEWLIIETGAHKK
jgi:hypothetical protein